MIFEAEFIITCYNHQLYFSSHFLPWRNYSVSAQSSCGILWWIHGQIAWVQTMQRSKECGSMVHPYADIKLHLSLSRKQEPSYLSMLPRVEHLSTLLTFQAVRMPVIAQGLAPLSKIDWFAALLTCPHDHKLISSENRLIKLAIKISQSNCTTL